MVWETLEEQEQLIASLNSKTGSDVTCDESYEDWGCCLDDQSSEYWEDYLGGPDEDEIERYYDNITLDAVDETTGIYDQELTLQDRDNNEGDEATLRVEDIVHWLSKSKLATKLQNNEGFCVNKGPNVRLRDGSIIDLVEWLYAEGIKGGVSTAGYNIISNTNNHGYVVTISFIKIIIDTPFFPLQKTNDSNEFDTEIPF